MQQGDVVGQSVVSKADLNLLNSKREDLEANRGNIWVSNVIDEMNEIKHASKIGIIKDTMHIEHENGQLY